MTFDLWVSSLFFSFPQGSEIEGGEGRGGGGGVKELISTRF